MRMVASLNTLVTELVEFAAACRLDYAASLVAESASVSVCPPSVRGECALGTDVLEDRQEEFECFAASVPHLVSMLLAPKGDPDAPDIPTPRSYAEAIEGPYSSQWEAAMDVEMASWKSTGTYVDEVPPPGVNIVTGMWIFRVKRPPGSPPVFKARYVARGFSQRHGVDFFHIFSPTPKMTTLRVLLHVAAQRDNELHSLDFSTAFLQGSLHKEIRLRRPPGFTGSFPAAPPSDESVEPSGPYPELVGCLMYLMTCTRPDLAYPLSLLARYVAPGRHQKVHWDAAKRVLRYLCSTSGTGLVLRGRARVVLTGHADASWVDDLATQWSSQGYTFSLGSGSVSWRSTRSSSVLSSSCEAEIYAGAMAAQELRWLTYLLTDLGEAPRSPPVLVGGVSSMRTGAVEELAIGAVSVAAATDVASAAADVVSAAVDVISSCRIVANALVLSASGMVFSIPVIPIGTDVTGHPFFEWSVSSIPAPCSRPRRRHVDVPSSRRARRTADPPSQAEQHGRQATEPPDSRAAPQPSDPSRPAAESLSSRAARTAPQPSRPSRPAAEPTEPPSRQAARAAELPCSCTAAAPADVPRPYLL
ncbi:unnamed protein product [Closterium sp. NIES-54]